MAQISLAEVKKRLDELVHQELENKRLPSISYVLIAGNETLVLEHAAAGGQEAALSEDSVFRVGSCSKMFTAIALMQLVEKGLVDLDTDVSTYIPGFMPPNPFASREARQVPAVTLRKLLSHTSGLVREPGVGHYFDDSNPPLADTVESLKGVPLKQDPHANVFRYSNAGFAVVGHVIERVSRSRFVDYMQQEVLSPIGMRGSSFERSEDIEKKLAPAYMWTFEGDFPAPQFELGEAPAGNLYANLTDMAEFVKTLLRGGRTSSGKTVLSTRALHSMWEPIAYSGVMGYGLGFAIGNLDGWEAVGHGGAVYGYATQCLILPEAQLGVVVSATLDSANIITNRIAEYALRLLLAANNMGEVPRPPRKPQPVTPCHLTALPGFYRDTETGDVVEIREREGRLYLLENRVPLRIQPRGEWDFVIDGRVFGPGSAYPHLEIFFSPPASGKDHTEEMVWKGHKWTRISQPPEEEVPKEIAPYIGEYGPEFNITHIFYENRAPRCLIEYFYPHTLEKLNERTYRMHGLLYEDEILVLGAQGVDNRTGINVGPMFFKRRG